MQHPPAAAEDSAPDTRMPLAKEPNLTLRDYFAARAMEALINVMDHPDPEYVAKCSYAHGDAMLDVRGRRELTSSAWTAGAAS